MDISSNLRYQLKQRHTYRTSLYWTFDFTLANYSYRMDMISQNTQIRPTYTGHQITTWITTVYSYRREIP